MEKKKNILKLMAVVAVLVLAGAVMVSSASAGIVGSKHDFSSASWSGTRICTACHTPHNSDLTSAVPLWGHENTTSQFSLYVSPTGTLDATMNQPSGFSKACLSCHDGTIALDSFGGATGSTKMDSDLSANLGIDLSDDHPVSFTYDETLATADGELATPASASAVDANGTVPLFAQKIECTTCHDVHNTANVPKMLVKSNAQSSLCLTCHTK